ncbi:MAG: histidine kinase [Candidatus Thorarchaeota archaeon]
MIDEDGLIIASNVSMDIENLPQLSSVISQLQEDQAIFSNPLLDNDDAIVLVAAQGGDRAVIGAFSISSILRSTLLGITSGSEESSYFLTDNIGHLLQSEGAELSIDNVSEHLGVMAALRGEVGSSFTPAEDGEHVVAFSPVQPTGWALILEEPWEAVTSPVLDLSLAAPLVLIPALLVTLIGIWFGARQVIGPIRKLQAQAEQLAHSNYEAIEESVGGIGEIQSLQSTLAWMAHNIREAQAALQRYIGAITDAQEDERRRLARELHDETIQDLIAIDQHIQMIRMELEGSTNIENRLGTVRQEVSDAIKELRRVIRALRPIYLDDLGLVPALQMLAKDTGREQEIHFDFNVHGDVTRLEPGVELAIYRIAQEALSNTVRHAQADRISFLLEFRGDTFILVIRDDGVGFSPPERPRELGARGHFGLMGMFERADLIGAHLELKSTSETGTQIRIELPISKD